MGLHSGSFDRFTERARKVLTLAQEEAKRFDHNYIGTEHLLLGLVREGEGVAAKVLSNLGIELTKVRSAVEFIIGRGERQVMGEIGLTPRAKKVIELAVDEARRLGHHYTGTEHLLLGLIREGEGIAAGVLESLGLSLERVRDEVLRVLDLQDHSHIASPPEPAITGTWEYRTLRTIWRGGQVIVSQIDGTPLAADDEPRIEAMLAMLGQEGWELAGIDRGESSGEASGSLYVFKRPPSIISR
jgi:hypothetical protein